VIGPAIGGLAALGGPHVPFYVAAGLAAVNAVAALVRLPETRTEHRDRPPTAAAPRSTMLVRLAIIGFIGTFAFTAFESTFSLFGSRRFGLTEGSTAVLFLGIGLVLVAVQVGGFARLAGRVPVGRLYARAVVLVAAGLAVVSSSTTWPVLLVGIVVLSVGQGLAGSSLTEMVNQAAPPDRRGAAMGFQQSAAAVGRVLGPPLAGAAFDRVGVWSPMASGSGLAVVALLLVVVWGLHRRETFTVAAARH